jgi:peptide/nickel transport system permease protein
MIPTFIGVTIVVSLGVRLLPGDVIDATLGQQGYGPEDRARLEHDLGLDKSWPEQYFSWSTGVVQGDLGTTLIGKRPIAPELKDRLFVSLELAALALAAALVIGIPLGIIAAVWQGSLLDFAARSMAIIALAVPGFWLGTLVIVYPAIWWNWTPPLFYQNLWDDPIANLRQMWIPALLLSLYSAGFVMRIMRSSLVEVMSNDYVRTAWAKGLPQRAIVMRHCVGNALIPVVTVIGLQLPVLIGGAVVFESIFVIPGIGRYLLDSITNRDYNVVQAITLVMAVIVMFGNLAFDVLYSYLDPRIRLS